jgi:hypothetical protein
VSAGELQGQGYLPPRKRLTPAQRIESWIVALWLVAWMFCQAYYPNTVWVRLMGAAIPFYFLLVSLPRWARHSEDDDEPEERLTPARRLVLILVASLFAASYAAFEYADWAYELSPDWMDYVFPAWLVMIGIAALAWPRNPRSEIDMRPIWAICAFLFAAFFLYSMTF